VFTSDADNLVPGDTNLTQDVFVADTTGSVSRVSADATGEQGNFASLSPSINAAGDEIAFTSFATNLNVRARSGRANVFLARSR
jgi:Tol biopolymer transport system component